MLILYFAGYMNESKDIFCKCLYYSSNALARVITKIAEEEFSVVGLSPSYAFILMTINKDPGINAGSLADIMMLTPSTVTRLVEKLEKEKYLKRKVDGRTTLIYPSAKSLKLNEDIAKSWHSLYKRYVKILGEKTAHQLTADIYDSAVRLDKRMKK